MVNASLISRLSQAVDQIENRLKQNHPWKVVEVRRGFREDGDVAQARHFAAYPEDQDADIVLFKFCYDEELADHCEDYVPEVGPARKEP